jgi:hypothetical protein
MAVPGGGASLAFLRLEVSELAEGELGMLFTWLERRAQHEREWIRPSSPPLVIGNKPGTGPLTLPA